MVFKWNDENTLLFLKNFKNYQCLWNHRLDEYKDRTTRSKAMKSLISDMKIEVTEEDIKHKIKTIRTRFTTELSKIKLIKKTSCSSDDIYVPTLYWFKHAEFLNGVCMPRQSKSNIIEPFTTFKLQDGSVDTQINSQVSQNYDSVESEQIDSQASGEKQKTQRCERRRNGSRLISPLDSVKPINRKRKYNDNMPNNRVTKEFINISERNKETIVEDEFDLFCKSLAVQLKKMPLDRALICQEKLQSMMTQERLTQLTQPLPEII